MTKKKILVTGGAGYIGAHTAVELTLAGYEAVIVDNFSKSDQTLLRGIEQITAVSPIFFKGDCCDKNFMTNVFESAGPFESVMHFAAFKAVGESVEQPLRYYQNNLNSLMIVIEVMQEQKVHDLIFSSSCTVYGQPDTIPVNEDAPFKIAESPYGATKQMAERILQDVTRNNLRVVSLRYFNPIGAHPTGMIGEIPVGTPNNLVPYLTQTAAGVREKLTIFGNDYATPDGTCLRDFIHVVDLSGAHVKAMEYLSTRSEQKLYDVFNLGTGVGVSVLQLIAKFKDVTNVDVPYSVGERRPGDVEKVFADPTKANKLLGWRTKFSIEESLLHAWQWEQKFRGLD